EAPGEERGEREGKEAEKSGRGDGLSDRDRLGRIAEARHIGDDAGDRRAEGGAERAHRGERGRSAALLAVRRAIDGAGDEMDVVDADAEAMAKAEKAKSSSADTRASAVI